MAIKQQTGDDISCEYCGEVISDGDDFVRAFFGSVTEGGGEVIDETERHYHWPSCALAFAQEHAEQNEDDG